MKKILIALSFAFTLSGCATVDYVKQYWPRDHDPVLFNQLVTVDTEVNAINCDKPEWNKIVPLTQNLSKYAEWRKDPQSKNMIGLHSLVEKMTKSTNKNFCESGKKIAIQRIEIAKEIWRKR